MHNFASPGSNPAVTGDDPIPYAVEVHDTRYQYGFAMTPQRLRKSERAGRAIEKLCALGTVAGNHGRFLFDFSPESVVLRLTCDPAPRILYVFDMTPDGAVDAPELLRRAEAGDIAPGELILGGAIAEAPTGRRLKEFGAEVEPGVRKAGDIAAKRLREDAS